MYGNKGSRLLLFVTGLGTGVALTVLLAPRSGVATRRLISRKVEEGQAWIEQKVVSGEEYARAYGQQFRDRVQGVAKAIAGK
jgi:gas vesicle protein